MQCSALSTFTQALSTSIRTISNRLSDLNRFLSWKTEYFLRMLSLASKDLATSNFTMSRAPEQRFYTKSIWAHQPPPDVKLYPKKVHFSSSLYKDLLGLNGIWTMHPLISTPRREALRTGNASSWEILGIVEHSFPRIQEKCGKNKRRTRMVKYSVFLLCLVCVVCISSSYKQHHPISIYVLSQAPPLTRKVHEQINLCALLMRHRTPIMN